MILNEKQAERLEKKKRERWSQKFSNAKIEDLHMMVNDIQLIAKNVEDLRHSLFILIKTLVKHNLTTQEQLNEVEAFENDRANKYIELIQDKSHDKISKEEKINIAKEYNLPLEELGL